jgi:uncharacterized protein YlzI (FlbEa/FlbD family)
MPLIKLNRINRGGSIFVNSDQILYMEVESKTTTVHMTSGLLFSVEESLESVVKQIEVLEVDRIKLGIQQSGLVATPADFSPPPA